MRPGLKGRARYAGGMRDTDPQVELLSNFSGNQDDNALSRRVALGQIDAGTDIVSTMLNAGRDGVTNVCREREVRQIGNVIDWAAVDPGDFIGSAVADVGIGVFAAVRDLQTGRWTPDRVQKLGLADSQAVRLSMADDVP
ncbi:MAG: BMP family ABC transporter substrate-binding protein, partial [Burkholderiaceae bacterium]